MCKVYLEWCFMKKIRNQLLISASVLFIFQSNLSQACFNPDDDNLHSYKIFKNVVRRTTFTGKISESDEQLINKTAEGILANFETYKEFETLLSGKVAAGVITQSDEQLLKKGVIANGNLAGDLSDMIEQIRESSLQASDFSEAKESFLKEIMEGPFLNFKLFGPYYAKKFEKGFDRLLKIFPHNNNLVLQHESYLAQKPDLKEIASEDIELVRRYLSRTILAKDYTEVEEIDKKKIRQRYQVYDSRSQVEEFDNLFNQFINKFPYIEYLKYPYAWFLDLISAGKDVKKYDILAHALLTRRSSTHMIWEDYLSHLGMLKIENKYLDEYLKHIMSFIQGSPYLLETDKTYKKLSLRLYEYSSNSNETKNAINTGVKIGEHIFNNYYNPLFEMLDTLPSKKIYEATVLAILDLLKFNGKNENMIYFNKHLYRSKHGSSSIILKYMYVKNILFAEKMYKAAASLLKGIISALQETEGENSSHPRLYNMGQMFCDLGDAHHLLKKYPTAEEYYTQALKREEDYNSEYLWQLHFPDYLAILAITLVKTQKYEEALGYLRQYSSLEDSFVFQNNLRNEEVKKFYLIALKKAGFKEEFKAELATQFEHLGKKQEDIFTRNIQRIKEAIAFERNFFEGNRSNLKRQEQAPGTSKKTSLVGQAGSMQVNEPEMSLSRDDYPSSEKDTREKGKEKEKVKTKGKADPLKQRARPTRAAQKRKELKEESSARGIEVLFGEKRGKALKTFQKLFDSIRFDELEPTDIDREDILHMFEALDQNVERDAHTKVTLDPKKIFGMDTNFKEKMLIIARHTKLKPYQIKQIRERFISWGLYPLELEEKLRGRGLLNLAESK